MVLTTSMTSCAVTMMMKLRRGRRPANGGLGEHRRSIRERQRLPERIAAIAPLAVQRVETVEKATMKAITTVSPAAKLYA